MTVPEVDHPDQTHMSEVAYTSQDPRKDMSRVEQSGSPTVRDPPEGPLPQCA